MINCLIIDDELPAIDIVAVYIEKVPYLNLIATTTSSIDGLNIANRNKIDLIFLDIQMPNLNGLEFINALNSKCKIIFTTAYSQYALDGFDLNVIDYLLKPIPFSRFLKAVQKAKEVIENNLLTQIHEINVKELEFIVVQGDAKGKLTKIEIKDIDYIEGMRNYVAICYGDKKVLSLMNMKSLEDNLPKQKFIRVHKSFIVAIEKIASVDGNLIKLKNNNKAEILIGTVYKTNFLYIMKSRMIN